MGVEREREIGMERNIGMNREREIYGEGMGESI